MNPLLAALLQGALGSTAGDRDTPESNTGRNSRVDTAPDPSNDDKPSPEEARAMMLGLIAELTGQPTPVETRQLVLSKAKSALDKIRVMATGDVVRKDTGEIIIAIYSSLAAVKCRGDASLVREIDEPTRQRLMGEAVELVAAALIGEAAHLYSTIEAVSNGEYTPAEFPARRALQIASTPRK